MEKDTNKNIEKLLMSLLVSKGISTTTIGKIMSVDRTAISRTIPVSDIQADIKKYGKK